MHHVIFVGFPVVVFTSGLEVTVVPERWSVRVGSGKIASRRQLPLKLAWAISIHKSQVWNVSAHSYITLGSTTVLFPDFYFFKCLIVGHIVVSFPNPKATSAWALSCLVSFPDPQQDSQYIPRVWERGYTGVGMRLYRVILEVI